MNPSPTKTSRAITQPGELAQLVGQRNKNTIVQLTPGEQLHTHLGVLEHDQLIGQPWGAKVTSHLGKRFLLVRPALDDLLRDIKRNTQILYPKDIGYILVSMGIGPGAFIVEAGTGSGAFTIALAHAVGPEGRVVSYERRPEMQAVAKANLAKLGLERQVEFKLRDIKDGFDEKDVDALFLDLPNPEDYVDQARLALALGSFFGSVLPTANQVSRLLIALQRNHFGFVEVSEILHRYYKAIPERLRPFDRMTGHTGFLIFARPVEPLEEPRPEDGLASHSTSDLEEM